MPITSVPIKPSKQYMAALHEAMRLPYYIVAAILFRRARDRLPKTSKAAFRKAAFSSARVLRRLSLCAPAGRKFVGGPNRGTSSTTGSSGVRFGIGLPSADINAKTTLEVAERHGMPRPLFAAVHHVAIICSDYERSKRFYSETLGLRIVCETYRAERDSYKLDLEIVPGTCVELFSFPAPPGRPTRPEACGLRHLAFGTATFDDVLQTLAERGVALEPVRIDETTGRRFTFCADPDGLPLEVYEMPS